MTASRPLTVTMISGKVGEQAPPPDGLTTVVRDAEYEEWPRGGVVFKFLQRRFIVYGDPQVFKYELQNLIRCASALVCGFLLAFTKDSHRFWTIDARSRRPDLMTICRLISAGIKGLEQGLSQPCCKRHPERSEDSRL